MRKSRKLWERRKAKRRGGGVMGKKPVIDKSSEFTCWITKHVVNTIDLGRRQKLAPRHGRLANLRPTGFSHTICNKRIHLITYTKFSDFFDVLFLCKPILRFCFRIEVKYFGICRRSIFRKRCLGCFLEESRLKTISQVISF